MKTIAVCLGFFILSIFVFNDSMAQKANYTTAGGWTLGIGGGTAYQKSDLANSKGFGLDLTIGSQIYRRENSFFSVDWKFRFLPGQNKAYDHRINPDGSYSNIRYSFFTYDLELGLTLNRLRERTGIVLTGFAGAGLTHGRTFTDLYDSGGNLYEFSSINPDRTSKLVYADLVALSDGDFETALVNKAAFLPTAGIFAGYQISRSLTLGIEFKTNFYLTEDNGFFGIDLDNKIISGSGIDRNSYVSLGLRWNLRGGSSYRRSTGTQVVPASTLHPTVHITEPSTESYRTVAPDQVIQATIYNVNGSDNIRFSRNGFPINDFSYNASTNTFVANVRLRDGENSFRIEATNPASTAEDLVVITLENPPEVATIAPWDSYTSSSGNYRTTTTHTNTIETTGNYQTGVTSGRTFVTYNEPVYYERVYNEPVHNQTVYRETVHNETVYNEPVSNETGGDIRDRVVVLENRPCRPPEIRLIAPAGGKISTDRQNYTLRADIRNVANLRELSLTVNGRAVSFTSGNNQISSTVPLVRGDNSIFLNIVNECGESNASAEITYLPSGKTDPESGTVTIVPEEEVEEEVSVASSIRFNPGNSDWQFCLVTPSGRYSRENLTNSNFSYSGAATSLYFMPIAGGGTATVNGQPYPVKSGQYYLFTGSLHVTISTKNPGAMGQWSVSISASRAPESGNGNNRPRSSCEVIKNETAGKNNANNRVNNSQVNRSNNNQVTKTNNSQVNRSNNNQVDKTNNSQVNRSNNNQVDKINNNPVKTNYTNPNNRSNSSTARSGNNNTATSSKNATDKTKQGNTDKTEKSNSDKTDKSNPDKTDKSNPDKTDKSNPDKTDKSNPDNVTPDKPNNRSRN